MSRAFSTGHHPLGTDLRIAAIADADDVAQLLSELGYPCDIDEAAERIAARRWWWPAATARWSA